MKFKTALILYCVHYNLAHGTGRTEKYDSRKKNGQARLRDEEQIVHPLASQNRRKDAASLDLDSNDRDLQTAADHHVVDIIRNGPSTQSRQEEKKKNATKKKLAKVKALQASENEPSPSPYKLTRKVGSDQNKVSTLNNIEIETNIVGGEQSQEGEFPYYGASSSLSETIDGRLCTPNIKQAHIFHLRCLVPTSCYGWMWWYTDCP